MQNKGLLIIVSGPSGVGKNAVLTCVRENYSNFRYSVSVTTRSMRKEDIPGVTYHFKSEEEFDKMVANGEFLEHKKVHGSNYGTPLAGVKNNLSEGYDVILEIDTQGALDVKKIYPDCVTIFIAAKSLAIVEQRLRDRKSETEEQIRIRVKNAPKEFEQSLLYDYIVINDVVEQCAADVLSIINAEKGKKSLTDVEKFKANNNKNLIDNILMEANNYDD